MIGVHRGREHYVAMLCLKLRRGSTRALTKDRDVSRNVSSGIAANQPLSLLSSHRSPYSTP